METFGNTSEGMAAFAEPEREEENVFAQVEVNLPQEFTKDDDLSTLLIEVNRFMGALGFFHESDEEAETGSFFKKLKYWFKNAASSEEAQQLYEVGKDALQLQLLDKPTAEATSQLAEAAGNLIKALEPFDNGVLRLGALLVIKVKRGEKSSIIAETVSPNLMHELASDPMMLRDPDAVFNLLVEKGITKEISDDGSDGGDKGGPSPKFVGELPKRTL